MRWAPFVKARLRRALGGRAGGGMRAGSTGRPYGPALLRVLGNQAALRLRLTEQVPLSKLAAALRRDSESGSAREREADRIADRVAAAPVSGPAEALATQPADERRPFEREAAVGPPAVRIHTGTDAQRAAAALGARAFTLGRDVYFGKGEYRPHEPRGRHLLAHELAHAAQQARAGAPALQCKLIATGDAAGFAALANAVIAVQYEVVVSASGEVSVRSTDVQGPPTPEAQELLRVLRLVIADRNDTTIEFIHGATSTRPSDRRVMVGSYPQSKVDLDDVAAFGTQGSVGVGMGRTAGALLAHEILEQYRKQVHGEAFDPAHAAALAAEAAAVGAPRGRESVRQISATVIEITMPYTYPGGRVVEVVFEVENGQVRNVRRRERR